VKLGQAADIITQHPCTSAPHSPDDGGNSVERKLDHHLPCTIYDDGAGSYRAIVKGFSI
jgi:hypothetical protein